MTCPNCQTEISEGKRFCGKCGAALEPVAPRPTRMNTEPSPSAQQCPHPDCGAPVIPGKKFCGKCGRQLQPAPPEHTAASPVIESRASRPVTPITPPSVFESDPPQSVLGVSPPPTFAPTAVLSTEQRRPPVAQQPSITRTGWVWKGALALGAIFGVVGIYYYVANAPMREFNDYLNKQMIINTNGPSAYSVYQKTMREKGPESSAIKSMNKKAAPVLQRISKDAFDSWYKDSELSKPPGSRAPGEIVVTTWADMVQVQEWLSNIDKNPVSNARLAYARGMAALNRRAWDEARPQFEDALRSQPNWSLALNGLGKAYFGKRQYDGAERYYRQASEADPSWYFPHSNLGTLYRDILKTFDASEREYRAAIQLDPSRPSFHFNLGLLYYMHGKPYWPSACSELRTALSGSVRSLTPTETDLATQRRDRACQAQ